MLLLFDLHYKPTNGEDPEEEIKKYLPYPYGGIDFWLMRRCIERIPREKWWQFTVMLWKPGDLQPDGSYAEKLKTWEIETFYKTFSNDRQLRAFVYKELKVQEEGGWVDL